LQRRDVDFDLIGAPSFSKCEGWIEKSKIVSMLSYPHLLIWRM